MKRVHVFNHIVLQIFCVWFCLNPASVFAQGFPPVGGGGTCTGMVNEEGFQAQQSAVNNALYVCAGGVWVEQPLIIGTTASACNAAWSGGIRYSSAQSCIELCNGTSWQCMFASACDSSPAFFVFTDQNSLGTSSLYSSNIVAVTGMDGACAASVSVSGSGTPEYRVCSTSNCSSVDITWTTANNSVAMQGKYIQLRATTAGTAGTTYTITASIGAVSSNWNITTTPTSCSSGAIGTVCTDGSVYAGTSPDGSVPMYVTRCDAGKTWNGSACINAWQMQAWNNGLANYVDTSLINCGSAGACDPSGSANTATLEVTDSDNVNGGVQLHTAAAYCGGLSAHGQTDWYLPSAPELNVLFSNAAAIGNFDTAGLSPLGGQYTSSSEYNSMSAWYQRFTDGSQSYDYFGNTKNQERLVRCTRK